jgi:hypothetical protein
VDFYYVLYRFFKYNPWGNPRQAYREVRYFIQRGRRGWSDRDVWSLDHYLSGWLPDALRQLKATKHGVPAAVVELEDCGEDGNTTEEGIARASGRWDVIMDKMIAAFEADQKINDGLYEKELGDYPLMRPSGVSADAWEKVKDNHFAASRLLMERDKKIKEEGLLLFVKFYNNLWD